MSDIKRFADLSSHFFYADEEKWIAEFIWDGHITGRQFAREQKNSKTKVATWQACFKKLKGKNIDTFHDD